MSLPSNDFGEFELLVYDSTGMTVSGLGSFGGYGVNKGAIAHPESNELEISWTGGACDHQPILTMSGDTESIHLDLDPAPSQSSIFPVSCPAVGLLFAATLTLSAPVQQEAVTLVVKQ